MNMVKMALLGAAGFVSAIGTAHAADVYGGSYKDASVSTPAIVWTGIYLGINAGATVSDDITVRVDDQRASADAGAAGLFGGQFGINYQTGDLVLGFEADIAGSGAELVSFLGTLRGRAGYAMGKSLIYVTGGLASLEWDLGEYVEGGYSTSGWVLGAGYEHKLSPSLSVGVEALHYSFNEKAADEMMSVELDRDMWAIRGRLNYHIDMRGDALK